MSLHDSLIPGGLGLPSIGSTLTIIVIFVIVTAYILGYLLVEIVIFILCLFLSREDKALYKIYRKGYWKRKFNIKNDKNKLS